MIAPFVLALLMMQDVVILRNGRRLEGRVEEVDGRVQITRGRATLTIDRSEIERIEYGVEPGGAPVVPWRRQEPEGFWVEPAQAVSVEIPAGWRVGQGGVLERPGAVFEGPGGARADLAVMREPEGPQAALRRLKEAYRRTDGQATFPYEETWEDGAWVEVRYRRSGDPVRAVAIARALPDARVALVVHSAEPGRFEGTRPAVEYLARSLRAWPPARVPEGKADEFCAAVRAGGEALDRALELAPDWPPLLRLRAEREQDAARRTEWLQRYVEAVADDAGAWWRLGWARVDAGDAQGAHAAFDLVVALEPQWPAGWIGRGAARLLRERPDEAEEDLARALRMDDEDVRGWYWLGAVRERLGRADDARRAYERALALEPAYAPALQALDRLRGRR